MSRTYTCQTRSQDAIDTLNNDRAPGENISKAKQGTNGLLMPKGLKGILKYEICYI